jgi:hypothetical protein
MAAARLLELIPKDRSLNAQKSYACFHVYDSLDFVTTSFRRLKQTRYSTAKVSS